MKIVEVIPHRVWVQKDTGRQASIYGCKPLGEGWEIEIKGWTWRNDNGTTGLGRVPAKTKEEAEEVMHKFNNRDWSK